MARLLLSPPHTGPEDREFLVRAFDSNWIAPVGPDLDSFEAELAATVGTAHVVALSSGTAALHLALELAGVGRGDTVLAATFTFVASVNPALYLGADLVFLDSEHATWNLDPNLLADELAERARHNLLPKAVIAVDLYGQPADYEPIEALCATYDVTLVADAAESLGASYHGRPAGSLGAASVLSFNGNKIITTSGGGALATNRTDWAERARYLSTQARVPTPHYEHVDVGYNYRLSNLLAALGRGQLRSLSARVAQKQAVRARYESALADLPGIGFAPHPPNTTSNCWLTCITIDPSVAKTNTDKVRLALEHADIESRPLWMPMHRQPVHAARRARLTGVSDRLFATGLCLPSGTAMTETDQWRVIEVIRSHVEALR